ncbi:hypothetical protein BD779DRAFT_1473556 [Infundibulicybe gibba]|nr:hypothetical protein BD779DRAFT_1473556 [Infundibulicybe gibba]
MPRPQMSSLQTGNFLVAEDLEHLISNTKLALVDFKIGSVLLVLVHACMKVDPDGILRRRSRPRLDPSTPSIRQGVSTDPAITEFDEGEWNRRLGGSVRDGASFLWWVGQDYQGASSTARLPLPRRPALKLSKMYQRGICAARRNWAGAGCWYMIFVPNLDQKPRSAYPPASAFWAR